MTFAIGQEVKVTLTRIGQEDWVFESEIVDLGARVDGVWVDHPECRGEDMLFINLTNPNINSVEVIGFHKDDHTPLKDIKKDINKAIRYEDGDIKLAVKIYDCDETGEQSYDVEVLLYIDDEYIEAWVTQAYYGQNEALREAKKRATVVLRTVKGWYESYDEIEIANKVEVYHA